MAGILRTLFKSKKSKKEEADNNEDLVSDSLQLKTTFFFFLEKGFPDFGNSGKVLL